MTRKAQTLLLVLGTMLFCGARITAAQNANPEAKPDFEKTGPQVGDQVPNLRLHTLKGEEQRLT